MMYTLTAIKAIAESANDVEVQDAILVHLNKDKFNDSDCVLSDIALMISRTIMILPMHL